MNAALFLNKFKKYLAQVNISYKFIFLNNILSYEGKCHNDCFP